jgi:Uma2 family endonuclease
MPLFVGEGYRPEPDIAVVQRSELNFDSPPSRALLIIEVSDSTLRFDRVEKASLYARAGIADYWILDLVDRVLEVHRAPRPDAAARFGFSYSSLQTLTPAQTITPLAASGSSAAVSDLLS